MMLMTGKWQHNPKRQTTRWQTVTYLLFAALLFAAPLFLSDFRLSLLAKFLAFAILALGLDLIWGYTGILSLGHGGSSVSAPTAWPCI